MSESEKKETLTGTPFKYLMGRTSQYRSIHVDGGWATFDHLGQLHLVLFHEHPPLPRFVTQRLGADGKWMMRDIKHEPFKEMEDVNVVRELEVEAVMTVEAARVVRDLLSSFILMADDAKRKLTETGGTK